MLPPARALYMARSQNMRAVSWQMTIIICVVVGGVVATGILEKDITSVGAIILTLLIALGVAELKEIKTNTNGASIAKDEHIQRLNEELTQYRLRDAELVAKFMEVQAKATEAANQASTTALPAPAPSAVTLNQQVKEADAGHP